MYKLNTKNGIMLMLSLNIMTDIENRDIVILQFLANFTLHRKFATFSKTGVYCKISIKYRFPKFISIVSA